jgi:hypothetical protein
MISATTGVSLVTFWLRVLTGFGLSRWRGGRLRVFEGGSFGGSMIFSASSGNMLLCRVFPLRRNSTVGMA